MDGALYEKEKQLQQQYKTYIQAERKLVVTKNKAGLAQNEAT